VCTVPRALCIGVIGVPLGTAIGQVISFVVSIYLARRKISNQISPFFLCISYVPALLAIAVAALCEWTLHNSLPTGDVGLILSGLLTVPAFVIYYGWVYREPLLQRFGTRAVAAQRRGRRIRRGGQPGRHRARPIGHLEHQPCPVSDTCVRKGHAAMNGSADTTDRSFAESQQAGIAAMLSFARFDGVAMITQPLPVIAVPPANSRGVPDQCPEHGPRLHDPRRRPIR
jgi:hypothetical protein